MKPLSGLLRFKTMTKIFLSLAFVALIFSLNQPILPRAIGGIQTDVLAYYANITILVSILLAAYCYFRYDQGLYDLDLTDKDVQQKNSEFEASPSQYKRDKARKARKMRQRKRKKR